MAKKRLNKKVALIGSVIFVFVMVAAIALILYLNRDPNKFITRGDAVLKAARAATDKDRKKELYDEADTDYRQALSLTKSDSKKVAIVFKLADLKCESDQWRDAMRFWNGILRIDPDNIRARFSRVKYVYLMADTGAVSVWNEVESQASELLKKAEEAGVLAEYTARWDPFKDEQPEGGRHRLDAFLHLARGRAVLGMTRALVFADQSESLGRATADLQKVKELEPDNVDAYWYLAMAKITKGEFSSSKGDLEARDRSMKDAKDLLEQAVKTLADKPKAYVNLLSLKMLIAQRSEPNQVEDKILALRPEYEALVNRFPSSGEAYSAMAGFYRFRVDTLDKSVEVAEKAVELDANNVDYLRNAAGIRYQRFCLRGSLLDLDKGVELARHALTLPGAQDRPGPRAWAYQRNRMLLLGFLAECYIEQVIAPSGVVEDSRKQQLLANAEEVVRGIEELMATGEAPQVLKWRGLLELARGNTNAAVKQLYACYTQLKSSDNKDSLVSYRLAKIFENTSEIGAVREFLESALRPPNRIDEHKPEALLDYAEVLLKLRAYGNARNVADYFERKYWANERSRRIRIEAYIGGGQFTEVEDELARRDPNSTDTIKLKLALLRSRIGRVERALMKRRIEENSPAALQDVNNVGNKAVEAEGSTEVMTAELDKYRDEFTPLVNKLMEQEPNSVSEAFLVSVCNYYMSKGRRNLAGDFIDRYMGQFPDSTVAMFYKRILAESDSSNITPEKRAQIEEEVYSEISEPVKQAVNLGKFYHRSAEMEKAAVEFRKLFQQALVGPADRKADLRRLAGSYLFEIALTDKDWKTAEELARVARDENFDDCGGLFYAGRLAAAQKRYSDALTQLDECLKERPIFSHGFLLRSNIHSALGDDNLAVADAQRAAQLDPVDGAISKGYAIVLYQRDKKLGDNVTSDQLIEAKRALLNAVRLNQRDIQLQSFYAEYISGEEPERALAIRQQLQKSNPSVENALLLGRMAMRLGKGNADSQYKESITAIAGSAFAEALRIDPQSTAALNAQAEYYRQTGQEDKAVELLTKSRNKQLLWMHYFRLGKFADANEILTQMYKADPTDESVVRGLMLVAEKTSNSSAVKAYSEKLIKLNDGIDNRLLQLQTFLKSGLVKEAEGKLQTLKKKFPKDSRVLLLDAWLAMRQGRLGDALKLINQNLASDQGNASAWRLKGRISLLRGDYTVAISALKESVSRSDELVTRYYLAKAYLGAGRIDDAIIELTSALNQPDAAGAGTAIERRMRQLLEQTYLQLGRKDALKRFYDATLAAFAESEFWHNRAGAFALSEGEYDQAEALYSKAIGIFSQKRAKGEKTDSGALLTSFDGYLNSLVLGAGTPQVANNWHPAKLDKVLQVGRKYIDDAFLAPVAYYRMAEAKMKLGDRATAVEYCRSALGKAFQGSQVAIATTMVRRVYSMLGAEEVAKSCSEFLTKYPEYANLAMFNLKVMSEDYNRALTYIDKCLQIAGADSPRRVGYVTKKADVLGLAYTKTSDNDYLKKAIKEYESLLSEMPNNIMILNNLAYMLASNNEKLDDAVKYARRAYEAKPNNPGFLDTYAFTLHKNGSDSEADQYIQASIQQYEQDAISVPAEVYEHLGMIKESLGINSEALSAYREALKSQGLTDAAAKRIKAATDRLTGRDETKK